MVTIESIDWANGHAERIVFFNKELEHHERYARHHYFQPTHHR